jgi:5-methylcytosine-specific restriction endonuclease McrA
VRPGGERRGNNRDRARRRARLLREFDPDLGPDKARCHLFGLSDQCLGVVDAITLTVDRVELGGSYCADNTRPACRPCQNKQGALITHERRRQWKALMDEARSLGIDWNGEIA